MKGGGVEETVLALAAEHGVDGVAIQVAAAFASRVEDEPHESRPLTTTGARMFSSVLLEAAQRLYDDGGDLSFANMMCAVREVVFGLPWQLHCGSPRRANPWR